MKLKDKVCVITGGTSGMGRAIAKLFFEEGAILIVNGRDIEKGSQLVEELGNERISFVPGDISKAATNELLISTAIQKYGKLDIVIANAGVLGLGNVIDLKPEDWDSTLAVNLSSLFYLSKYGMPSLIENKGVMIANASIAAFKSFPNHPAYCASKAAVVALSKQLALDFAPNVRINAICPGPVDTPLIWESASAFREPEKAVESAADATLMKRLGKSEEIASLALFLASGEASWITGTTINIDGGIMA